MKLSLRVNAVLKILLSVFNIIIPLVVGPFIIRMLSRTSYDTYTKASVEIQLFLTLSTIGIYTYGVRSISRIRNNKESTRRIFSELVFLGLIANAIFSLLYVLYITFINNHQNEIIYWILMIQFLGSSVHAEWMNEALEKYRFITFKSMVVKFLYIASIFIFIRKDDLTLYGMIVSLTYVLENAISFVYILFHYKIKIKKLKIKRHLKPLGFMFLIANISLLYVQADKMMLGLLLSDSAVTVYTLPNYIVTSIYNVVISLLLVAIPRLNSFLGKKNEEEYQKLYNEVTRIFLMIFVPILFYVFANAFAIIALYGAGKYNDCIFPLQLFTVTIFFNSLVYIQREGVLYLKEKEKRIIVYNSIGGGLNFLSNWILYFTGFFTPVTCIITLAVSYLIVAVFMRIYIRKQVSKEIAFLSLPTWKYLFFSVPILAIGFFGTGIENLLLRIFVTFTVSVIVYMMLLVFFKDTVFINNLKSMKSKLKTYWTKRAYK